MRRADLSGSTFRVPRAFPIVAARCGDGVGAADRCREYAPPGRRPMPIQTIAATEGSAHTVCVPTVAVRRPCQDGTRAACLFSRAGFRVVVACPVPHPGVWGALHA